MSYETVRDVTSYASVVLQDNPGPMTLEGTNTWLLGGGAIVVDPGQAGAEHLEAVLAAAPNIALILVTHGHFDHSEAGPQLHARSGAPVRAFDTDFCLGAGPLRDGEVLDAGGMRVRVLHTPGHTADSVSFVVDDAALLTGDTILGRGTTVVAHPDGALGPYLDSLRKIRELGDMPVLPGHGPELPSAAAIAETYLAHRAERLDQVRAALAELGADASARQIVEHVYTDVDESVWWAAELSVRAQLDYLNALGGPAARDRG